MRLLIASTAVLSLALLAFVRPVFQEASPEARAKELLAPYAGTWDTTMSMAGMESKGQEVVTALPHGLAVTVHSTSDMGPMGKYEGHGIMGFEPKTGRWHHVWADSMTPGMSVTTGRWSDDGKDFIVESEEDMGMGPMKVVMTMHKDDADHMTWTMRAKDASDGAAPIMSMKYTRRK